MLDRSNNFWRFCCAICDKDDVGEDKFRRFLEALRPMDSFGNASSPSLERFSILFSPEELNVYPSIRVANIVDLAKCSGYETTAAEVNESLRMMKYQGIAESDIATVFRRCRTTMSSNWARLRRIGDPMWMEASYNSEFENAIVWVQSGGRRSKAKTFPRKFYLWGLLAASVVLLAVSVTKSLKQIDADTYTLDWSMGNWMYGLVPMLIAGTILAGVSVYYCIAHKETVIAFFWVLMESYGFPMIIAAIGLLIFAIGYGIILAVSFVHWGILWQFAGIAIGITAGVDLLIWGFVKASTSGGSAIDRSHEWRIVTRNGSPGGRLGPATMKDLYEHTHGHGSWERRNDRISKTGAVLASLTVVICPLCEIPFLLDSGVQGIGPIAGYFLIYPLLPLAVIGGLIYWLSKISPPLNIR